jgi:hypothetical protein
MQRIILHVTYADQTSLAKHSLYAPESYIVSNAACTLTNCKTILLTSKIQKIVYQKFKCCNDPRKKS